MKIFISWSKERSKAVALALYDWLPKMFQEVRPWMSEHDIAAGARGLNEIAVALEDSQFGIVCITPENRAEPWIHFEAGAISKQLNGAKLVPYLYDLSSSDFVGPLSQFQRKLAEKKPTFEIVQTINPLLRTSLSDQNLIATFERWWPDLENALSKIPPTSSPKPSRRPNEAVLDEILEIVRNLRDTKKGITLNDSDISRLREFETAKAMLKAANENRLASHTKNLETAKQQMDMMQSLNDAERNHDWHEQFNVLESRYKYHSAMIRAMNKSITEALVPD